MAKHVINKEYLKEIDKARRDLRALISTTNCAPLMLRLAWHDAGTYDAKTRTGGPNGSIRNVQELNHSANKGLHKAVQLCEEVKTKHPILSYADIYQLAGVVAVEVTGGPTIDFIPGRKAHLERSGYDGQWTREHLKFDNSYFVELLKADSKDLLKLPTDMALVEDPKFRKYVELYATDEDAFLEDYAASHKKLSELGLTSKHVAENGPTLAQGAIAVVIAITVVILGYLIEVNRKTK
ncbi:hypothetical protein TanjilG_18029 [Lupinus angustifolius]|uniref:Plant heme peroxidase family profile domain-containing protein n=1 Tax=Lupinus angustifolius TaxID=3871 RepID=A0A1J7FXD3_LUPAN|nr:hypothetical protein TanjilG_18029 [Lupinus angustifolius]